MRTRIDAGADAAAGARAKGRGAHAARRTSVHHLRRLPAELTHTDASKKIAAGALDSDGPEALREGAMPI